MQSFTVIQHELLQSLQLPILIVAGGLWIGYGVLLVGLTRGKLALLQQCFQFILRDYIELFFNN